VKVTSRQQARPAGAKKRCGLVRLVLRAVQRLRQESEPPSQSLPDLLQCTRGLWKRGDGLVYQREQCNVPVACGNAVTALCISASSVKNGVVGSGGLAGFGDIDSAGRE